MSFNVSSFINSRFPFGASTGMFGEVFPKDLQTNGRNFYTQIQFQKYEKRSVFNAPFLSPIGGVTLPLPKKINEQQSVVWEGVEGSTVAAAIEGYNGSGGGFEGLLGGAGAAGTTALSNLAKSFGGRILGNDPFGVAGAYAGLAPNPFLTMLFKSGQFKQHQLQWTFTPTSSDESETLVRIINFFKQNMLPSYLGSSGVGSAIGNILPNLGALIGNSNSGGLASGIGGAVLQYPNIAIIQLYPDDFFTFRFKPCVVDTVSIDYSGAGGPSFFKNGAPTVINMTVVLKEIELWMQEDFAGMV